MRFRYRSISTLALITGVASAVMAQGITPPSRTKPLDGQIIESRQFAPDNAGIAKHLKVIKTNLRYSYIRVEQQVHHNSSTGAETVVGTKEMVADHIIVKLRPGKSLANLVAMNNRLGTSIRETVRQSEVYLVALPHKFIDAVPNALDAYQKEGAVVEYAEPDYLLHLDTIPNDARFDEQWDMHNTGQGGGTVDADIDAPEAWGLVATPHNR